MTEKEKELMQEHSAYRAALLHEGKALAGVLVIFVDMLLGYIRHWQGKTEKQLSNVDAFSYLKPSRSKLS